MELKLERLPNRLWQYRSDGDVGLMVARLVRRKFGRVGGTPRGHDSIKTVST